MSNDYVVVFDVDGILTDSTFWQSKDGKQLKRFGADDWDAVRELMKFAKVSFVTADKKGFPIVQKRIEDEMKFDLDLVPNKPIQSRWEWIKTIFPDNKIIYVGDGIYDWFCFHRNIRIKT